MASTSSSRKRPRSVDDSKKPAPAAEEGANPANPDEPPSAHPPKPTTTTTTTPREWTTEDANTATGDNLNNISDESSESDEAAAAQPLPDAKAEALAAELARTIINARRGALFVTGAGISCASGIAAFRTGDDAVWSKHVTAMGTKKAFKREPLEWFNSFWLPTFESSRVRTAKPSPAHKALARIASRLPRTVRVVTQNVDGLHCARLHGPREGVADPQLVEAHGRYGLFRCAGCDATGAVRRDGCDDETAKNDWYELDELDADDARRIAAACGMGPAAAGTTTTISQPRLQAPPRCPKCKVCVAMPLALLFDEIYDAHFFFEADAWDAWLDEADVIVFVGTSFAVELTREALRRSRQRSPQHGGVPVYDVNVQLAPPTIVRSEYLRNHTLLGDCQRILPRLAYLVDQRLTTSSAAAEATSSASEHQVAASSAGTHVSGPPEPSCSASSSSSSS